MRSPRCILFLSLWLIAFCFRLNAAQRPNLLLIYTDDQGYGDVNALNPESRFQTPHLDRLVREGLTFTDGHCSDTVCTPSRYGLLTGRYSWRTSLKSGVMGADADCLITPGRLTLASLLKNNGYHTAMVGKWHLGMQIPGELGRRDWSQPVPDGPVSHGFEYYYGIPASMNYGVLAYFENDRITQPPTLWTAKKPNRVKDDRASYRIIPPYLADRSRVKSRLGKPIEVAPDFVDSECLKIFTEKSIDYIKQVADDARAGKPFFVYVPLTSPHKPVCPAEEFLGKSQCGLYGDFMMETDHRVGQLLATLDDEQLAEKTIVIFTSDNGAERTWEARIRNFGHRSSLHFKGGKRDIYEGGHRVPFLVRWPAQVKAGSTCDTPVCQTDILATMADLLDVPLPANAAEDSESLLPAFRGEELSRGALLHHSSAGFFAIREGRWKLNLFRGSGGSLNPKRLTGKQADPPMELYDLAADPSETKNVYAEHPDVVERLTQAATRLVQGGGSRPGAKSNNDGPQWWKQLTWIDGDE